VRTRVDEDDAPPLELSLLLTEVARLEARRALIQGRVDAALVMIAQPIGAPEETIMVRAASAGLDIAPCCFCRRCTNGSKGNPAPAEGEGSGAAIDRRDVYVSRDDTHTTYRVAAFQPVPQCRISRFGDTSASARCCVSWFEKLANMN
jgi:hypothetical protein